MTVQFNENSSNNECQSDSTIQRTSEETESERSKTSRDRES